MRRAGTIKARIVGATMAAMVLGAGGVALAPPAAAAQAMAATTWVNMRSGPSTSYGVLSVLAPAQVVQATGRTSGGWHEVSTGSQTGWVYQTYLTGSGSSGGGATASGSTTTRTAVNIRSGPGLGHAVVGVAAGGATLQTTGKTSGGWTEVIFGGVARWVSTNYTTGSAGGGGGGAAPAIGSVSLGGYEPLNANAKAVVQHVIANYPRIRSIGGYRAGSAYSSDHPGGRAVDVMVPGWSTQSGIDYGQRIADDFAANAGAFKVTYIIWRQHSWNASYPERGWRPMADRGSATANHMDHVHVSVRP